LTILAKSRVGTCGGWCLWLTTTKKGVNVENLKNLFGDSEKKKSIPTHRDTVERAGAGVCSSMFNTFTRSSQRRRPMAPIEATTKKDAGGNCEREVPNAQTE
jgi:hypothetical protein